MIDHWEVDRDLVNLEEELGEGAFSKVYKGFLKELTTTLQKLSMMPPINAIRKSTIKQTGGFTVAVKMLHGELYCVLFWEPDDPSRDDEQQSVNVIFIDNLSVAEISMVFLGSARDRT